MLIYFDAEGREPPYEPHIAPEIAEEGVCLPWEGNAICKYALQDFAENSSDTAHFGFLHETFPVPILRHFIKVKHNVVWGRDEEKRHQAFFTDTACLTFRGKEIPKHLRLRESHLMDLVVLYILDFLHLLVEFYLLNLPSSRASSSKSPRCVVRGEVHAFHTRELCRSKLYHCI